MSDAPPVTDPPPAPWFARSLVAAARLADRESIDDLGTALTRGVAALQMAGVLLDVDYQAEHESGPTGWLKLAFFAEGLYQQLHAAATMAVILIDERAEPRLGVKSVAGLQDRLAAQAGHPLRAAVDDARRELSLLRWLCTVRNKAVQHRAEEGYTGGRAVVMHRHFALLSSSRHPGDEVVAVAYAKYVSMVARHGAWEVDPVRSREMVTYLDLCSHELLTRAPNAFDECRAVVEAAGVHDLVVSAALLHNADAALARLVGIAGRQ